MEEEVGFSGLGLPEGLVARVSALGYGTPTPVQAAAIPALLEGRDVLGRAATGTGKTAAFALPVVATLGARAPGAPRALVLTPTRELAAQVADAMARYAEGTGLRVLAIVGGADLTAQARALHRGVDIVVATPGRAIDHLVRGNLKLDAIRTAVVDEADVMLDMGFAEDLETLLQATPDGRQLALFSATFPDRLRKIADAALNNPVIVEVRQVGADVRVRHIATLAERHQRAAAVLAMLEFEGPSASLLFCRTRADVEALSEALDAAGRRNEALHGGLSQAARDAALRRLRDGTSDVVVATDVAARGIDVPHLTHVFHVDLPTALEDYVHRSGRVGRAGREGVVISFVSSRERARLRGWERQLGHHFAQVGLPTPAALAARRVDRFREALSAVAPEEAEAWSEVVSQWVADKPAEEWLAAVLANVLGPPPAPPPAAVAWTRVHVGAGSLFGVRPVDLFQLLLGTGGLTREEIGRIHVGDRRSWVDVPETHAGAVIDALRGVTFRGRAVVVERFKGTPDDEPPR